MNKDKTKISKTNFNSSQFIPTKTGMVGGNSNLPFRGQGVLFLLFCAFILSAQNFPSGKSILDKVDNNILAKTRIVTSRTEIETARGTRTMESKTWSEGDQKVFTEYLSPAREKGTKMLKLDKQLWIFSPATDRVVQISGHMLRQSVMGATCHTRT